MTPRIPTQKIPLSQVAAALQSNDSIKPVVLVVDDELLVADTLVAILNKLDYSAFAAYNGEEALAIARLITPQYLITDVLMPGMSGFDLAICIQQLHPDCCSVLFSGHTYYDMLSTDPRWSEHQFPLLSKPIHPDALITYIASLKKPWTEHPSSLGSEQTFKSFASTPAN